MTRKISLTQFADDLRRAGAGARDVALDAIEVTVTEEIPRVVKRAQIHSFNTGQLARSFRVERDDGAVYLLNTAGHAVFVEGGRKKGARRPPRAPIALWAQRKLGLGKEDSERAAWGISISIARKGIKPRENLYDDDFVDQLAHQCAEAVGTALLKLIDGVR